MVVERIPFTIEEEFRRFYESSEVPYEDKREVSEFIFKYYHIMAMVLKPKGSYYTPERLTSAKKVREHIGMVGELVVNKWKVELLAASNDFHKNQKSYMKVLFALPIFFAIPVINISNYKSIMRIIEHISNNDEIFAKDIDTIPADIKNRFICYDNNSGSDSEMTVKHTVTTIFPLNDFRKLFDNFLKTSMENDLLTKIAFFLSDDKFKYSILGLEHNDIQTISIGEADEGLLIDKVGNFHSLPYISIAGLHEKIARYNSLTDSNFAHQHSGQLDTILKESINVFLDSNKFSVLSKYQRTTNSYHFAHIINTIASHIDNLLKQAANENNDFSSFNSTLQKIATLQFFHPSILRCWYPFNLSHKQFLNQININFAKHIDPSNSEFIDFVDKAWREVGPKNYINIAHQISYLHACYYSAERSTISRRSQINNEIIAINIETSSKPVKDAYRNAFVNFLNALYNISDPNAIHIALETLDKAIDEQLEIQTNSAKTVAKLHNRHFYKISYFSKYFTLDEIIYILIDIHRKFSRKN